MLSYLCGVMQSRIQLVRVFYVLAALYVLAQESDYFASEEKPVLRWSGRSYIEQSTD
jgi:hypothetical protein